MLRERRLDSNNLPLARNRRLSHWRSSAPTPLEGFVPASLAVDLLIVTRKPRESFIFASPIRGLDEDGERRVPSLTPPNRRRRGDQARPWLLHPCALRLAASSAQALFMPDLLLYRNAQKTDF